MYIFWPVYCPYNSNLFIESIIPSLNFIERDLVRDFTEVFTFFPVFSIVFFNFVFKCLNRLVDYEFENFILYLTFTSAIQDIIYSTRSNTNWGSFRTVNNNIWHLHSLPIDESQSYV